MIVNFELAIATCLSDLRFMLALHFHKKYQWEGKAGGTFLLIFCMEVLGLTGSRKPKKTNQSEELNRSKLTIKIGN